MLSADEYSVVHATTPVVSVDLVVFNGEGKVLLGKRRNEPARGAWYVPRGRMWKDETVAEASRRISRGELGVEMQISRLLGAYHQVYTDTQRGRHFITFAATLTPSAAQIAAINHDDQHEELKWWATSELLESPDVHLYTKSYFSPAPWNKIVGNP